MNNQYNQQTQQNPVNTPVVNGSINDITNSYINQDKNENIINSESTFNLNRFEIKFSYDFTLMSCLDLISNKELLYKHTSLHALKAFRIHSLQLFQMYKG